MLDAGVDGLASARNEGVMLRPETIVAVLGLTMLSVSPALSARGCCGGKPACRHGICICQPPSA